LKKVSRSSLLKTCLDHHLFCKRDVAKRERMDWRRLWLYL